MAQYNQDDYWRTPEPKPVQTGAAPAPAQPAAAPAVAAQPQPAAVPQQAPAPQAQPAAVPQATAAPVAQYAAPGQQQVPPQYAAPASQAVSGAQYAPSASAIPEWQPAPVTQQPSHSSKAIAALVLGIASIIFVFTPVLGFGLGVAAIVLGVLAKKVAFDKGLGIAGMVTGIVGLVLNLLFTLLMALIIGSVAMAVSQDPDALTGFVDDFNSQMEGSGYDVSIDGPGDSYYGEGSFDEGLAYEDQQQEGGQEDPGPNAQYEEQGGHYGANGQNGHQDKQSTEEPQED